MDGKNSLLLHKLYSEFSNNKYAGWICTYLHELHVWPLAYSAKVLNISFSKIIKYQFWVSKQPFLSFPHSVRRIMPKYLTFCVHKLNQNILFLWISLKSSITYCFDMKLSVELLMRIMRLVVQKLQSCSFFWLGISGKTSLWWK